MSRFVRRSFLENLARRSWRPGPNPILWLPSVLYGGILDARNVFWTLGVARSSESPIPIISVGGLTIGGSGKTPVTAALARYLADAGLGVAVLTPGQKDELEVHTGWNSDVPVTGGRSRAALTRRAADLGAEVGLLDSGFQHRRLARDLDVVTILVDQYRGLKRLPAGPARERWAALDRAHVVVLVRRLAPKAVANRLEQAVREAFPQLHVAHVTIRADSVSPVSTAARAVATPDPQLAVAGVMWPELFFAGLGDAGVSPAHQLALADHAELDRASVSLITELAGTGGIVCTAKDSGKLAESLPDSLPLWRIDESVVWGPGGDALLAGIEWQVRQDSYGADYSA